MEGLTGRIKFDSLGFRSDFDLDVIELKKEGLVKVGSWNQGVGVNFTRNYTESYTEIVESLHNKTLKITTILVSSSTSALASKSKIIIRGIINSRYALMVPKLRRCSRPNFSIHF